MPTRKIPIADGLDVAWIIELWKALHGADADSQTVAVEAIAALEHYLKVSSSTFLSRPLVRDAS